jgi:predicted butyrate kinase (DUF1464 family)
MPRVIGIDPGTISVDLCGLDDGRLFLDRSIPTAEAMHEAAGLVHLLDRHAPLDLVAGPSGYGLPLVRAADATDDDLRLACLAPEGVAGGIGGLRRLMRLLARGAAPVVFTPGVIHLPSVPAHRKVNRVDMGTADKVSAVVLALSERARATGRAPEDVSFVLVELGGAFTAVVAVAGGRIVDGLGGSSGPMGLEASGALDGEVAFLAGQIGKDLLFTGGFTAVAGASFDGQAAASPRERLAWRAYVEGVVKAVASVAVWLPGSPDIVLSGRVARSPRMRAAVTGGLAAAGFTSIHPLEGFASVAKHAAQGAALMADGLAGGASAPLVAALGLRDATGSVLDHLHLIDAGAARRRIGIAAR